jgi:hypothetical protein
MARMTTPTLPPMRRLAREFDRLYGAASAPSAAATAALGAAESVRALVLEVARPAAWQPLAAVWRGVQSDLALPAPAIAVNGSDGVQLWFSLADAVAPAQGLALLERLRQRYLADLPVHRVAMHAAAVPPAMPRPIDAGERWAAFVAADLAALFDETPWLDLPPNEDGQADLLSRVASIRSADLQAALALLPDAPPATPPRALVADVPPAAGPAAHPAALQFLLAVMHDEAAPLALRIDAAKALLPHGPGR